MSTSAVRGFALLFGCAGCVAPTPSLVVSPAALELGFTPVGVPVTAPLTLQNAGEDVLALDALVVAAGDPAPWDVTGDLADLFPGARGHARVTFRPRAAGTAVATLLVLTDDPAAPTTYVPLRGVGLDADAPDPGDNPDGGVPGPGDGGEPDDETACGDADGDGHDLCDPGGDCDDADPAAHPVVVDAAASGTPDGTVVAPYPTLTDALGALDGTCREVVLRGGVHAASVTWDDGALHVRAAAGEAALLTPPAGAPAFVVGPAGALTLIDLTLAGARPRPDGAPTPPGGALRVEGGTAQLANVQLVDNTSDGDGGAIGVIGGKLTLEHAAFLGNAAAGDGGALYARDAEVHDLGSTFVRNRARAGGAVAAAGGALTLDGTRTRDNAAVTGGALFASALERLCVERIASVSDTASWRGGALAVDGVADGLVRNSTFQGARAGEDGGAVAVAGCSTIVLANNTVVDARAGDDGAALWLHGEAPCVAHAWSNILAWADGESGVDVADDTPASVGWTLAWGGAADIFDLPSAADAGENRVADPRFRAYTPDGLANDDLTLAPDSPARDTGPPDGAGPTGHTTWADGDGSPNDRGYTGGPGAG